MSDFLGQTLFISVLALAAPLLMAAVGELIMERAGVLNLSIEGQMTLGAAITFLVVRHFDGGTGAVLLGLLAAAAGAAVIGVVLAHLSLDRGIDQIAVGLSLLFVGLGASALVYRVAVGTPTTPPHIDTLEPLKIPLLSDIPWIGEVLFDQTLVVYAAFLAVPIVGWVLFRTSIGLRLRASGENPRSVDSLGLPLRRIRYSAVIVGSGLIGVGGGMFLLTIAGGAFAEDMIGGRGWLALLLVIFGRWRPLQVFIGALLFAYLDALRYRLGVSHPEWPNEFFQMLPYVAAALVLAGVYGRTRAPAALGQTYSREARD